MSITIAHTRSVYDINEVHGALDRMQEHSPELKAFYLQMIENGPERFVTKPSSTEALDPLYEECPNFSEILDDLKRYLGLALAGNGSFNVLPVLLLGDPGVGKTHFGKRLSRALETEFEFISMNALSAGFVITGSSATWKGAKCGRIAERLVNGQYANPVVVLDEVEKATGSTQSNPMAALYQLLEPETSSHFHDEFIDLDIDASQIFWVLTANSLDGIPEPLLNRMAVYEVPAPSPVQTVVIAQNIYAGLLKELKLEGFDGSLKADVLEKLATVSPRDMRKILLDGLGFAVAAKRSKIHPDDIRMRVGLSKRRMGF